MARHEEQASPTLRRALPPGRPPRQWLAGSFDTTVITLPGDL